MRHFAVMIMGAAAIITSSCCNRTESPFIPKEGDYLYEGWTNPPHSARPHVWWHWMNGNITKEGIRKDMEWFDRIGVGGVHIFDASFSTPQIVEKRLPYMSRGWKEAFSYAISLADSLGMDVVVPSSPGFSSTGGPWVKPEDAMKKVVWREMTIEGGGRFEGPLPEPHTTTGKFQNYGMKKGPSSVDSPPTAVEHYQDIGVVAVKLPETYEDLAALGAEVTSSGGSFTLGQLTDGDLSNTSPLPAGEDGYAWIQYGFKEPQTIRALSVVNYPERNERHSVPAYCLDSLQVSDDGVTFRTVMGIPVGDAIMQTISFEGITARYFRLKHRNPVTPYHYTMGDNIPPDPDSTPVAEFVIYPQGRINHTEEKAGFGSAHDIESNPTPDYSDRQVSGESIDISRYVNNGRLCWDVPPGKWRIYRFGASMTGKLNHPATPEATGFEVDKLDKEAWSRHFRNYLTMNRTAAEGMVGERGIRYVLVDSYEAGHQNWTPRMREEFAKRRGYDLMEWMPVLTGAIVESVEKSERFLWDFRKTIGELFEENFARMSHIIKDEFGMKGAFLEAHANGRAFIADGMAMKQHAEVPMSELWIQSSVGSKDRVPEGISDIRESSSVAHIYGKKTVSAESFTCIGYGGQAYIFHPGNLKWTADTELSCGLNHFVIHDSAHQPADSLRPGLGLGAYGQWFTRHETWAESAGCWMDYLSRSSFMMQQGTHVSDILWYYGEDNNITGLYSHSGPEIPYGYDFDYLNPDALLSEISAKDGKAVTRHGKEYKVICLDPNASRMSMKILEKIASLARDGVLICGEIPASPASMYDDTEEFEAIVNDIWHSGRKNVFGGWSLKKTLDKAGIAPDWKITGADSIRVVHRKLDDGEIYWINSASSTRSAATISLNISGLKPYKWDPVTGSISELSYRFSNGRTVLKLDFEPQDAFFVVFRDACTKKALRLSRPKEKVIADIPVEGLGNWAEVPETKHFSGTRSYTFSIGIPQEGDRFFLDLGDVRNIAQVYVNGHQVATLWKQPFKTEITEYIEDGKAEVEVRVTNVWANRIIGEAQLEEKERTTYIPFSFYKGSEPLLPSGLIGPVRLTAI